MIVSEGGRRQVLLLSGGIDSAALAAWLRPTHTLFIDYGQLPAAAEGAAARAIAGQLDLPHSRVGVDLSVIGAGLLSSNDAVAHSPSPEWWPFRNQLLVSIAAAWTIRHRGLVAEAEHPVEIVVGSVGPDGLRHRDGSAPFYSALDALLRSQEGDLAVAAPGLQFETPELVRISGVDDATLGWTHSCHRANLPCLECPGCHKRADVLGTLDRLQ